MVVALTLLGSLVTSFIGSFLCFVIWVHFDFDAKWEARKYRRHADALRAEDGLRESYGGRPHVRTVPMPDTHRDPLWPTD